MGGGLVSGAGAGGAALVSAAGAAGALLVSVAGAEGAMFVSVAGAEGEVVPSGVDELDGGTGPISVFVSGAVVVDGEVVWLVELTGSAAVRTRWST